MSLAHFDKDNALAFKLFDSTSLGHIALTYRFVRSATWEGMASDDAASRFTPIWHGRSASEEPEVYYREAAQRFKATLRVPLILVGGIRSYTVAKRLIEDGIADYISLCRPLIREPHLVARWRSGHTEKSACGSCNMCYRAVKEGNRIRCVAESRQPEKEESR
jgi:2,4-dienoyl-CoA reductase-like NADH-dependent reductase (Old Yellow Enzyme family)